MERNIRTPTRIIIIGASETGKSELVKNLIRRGVFGEKKKLEIYVFSPTAVSLNQPLWQNLSKHNHLDVKYVLLHSKTPCPPNPRRGIERLVIYDDLDYVMNLPLWVSERFTTSSHHLNENVVCISHKLKIGSTCIRNCCLWVVITYAPEASLRNTCKELGLNYDLILKHLSYPENKREPIPHTFLNFNSVFVDIQGKANDNLYKINNFTNHNLLKKLS